MSFGSLPSVLGNGGGVAISVIGGTGLFADGTAAAPSISFAADTDTGFYRNASGQMGFSANGALSLWFATGGRLYGASVEGYTEMPSGGGVNLVAAGSNKNITLTPSGTGFVDIVGSNDASFANALRVLTPTLSNNNSALILLGKASAANQSAFINYVYSTTASNTRLDFGHNGTTGQVSLMQTGRFLIGTGGVDSGALLQIGTNTTTSAGGMVFGTDCFLYRNANNTLAFNGTSGLTLALYAGGTQYASIVDNGANLQFNSANGIDLRTGNASAGTTALTLDASQNAAFVGTGVSTAGLSVNLGDQSKTRYALFGNSSNGAGRCAVISQMRALNYDDTFFGRNLVAVPTTDAAKTLESSAYAGMLLRFDGNIDWVANVSSTAGASITPTVRMSLSNAGLLTMTGALRLNNAYVAGAVVGTGYVTIQDSTGTTYRIPVLV